MNLCNGIANMKDTHCLKKLILSCLFCCFVSISWSQIINVEDKRKLFTDSIQWFEKLSLGFDLNQNTETVVAFQGSAQLEFAFKNKLLISITSARFVKGGETNFVNEGFQHLRYNSNINNWLTFELFGQVQYNEAAFIKLRALGGTGPRFRIANKEKQQLFVGLSYMYEYDEEKNGIVHQDSRLNSYLSFGFKPGDMVDLSGTMYFQPLFESFQDYRLSAVIAATFYLNEKLSFSTRYAQTYDSRRPEGAPRQIYSLSNLISYQF
jgi:hypothetical protein